MDFGLFFSHALVLLERQTDKLVIESASDHLTQNEIDLRLEDKDILVVQAGGAEGFPKYKKIVDAFGIRSYS